VLRFTHLITVALVFAACGGAKPKPDIIEEEQSAEDILDAPIPQQQRPKPKASLNEAMMLLPETPEKPSREIDAKTDDWKTGAFRRFETREAVESGANFWNGRRDASFRVGVDADEGFLYFMFQVKDDVVVDAPQGQDPTDGLILWLRDPGLDTLGKALPSNVGLEEYVDPETAIIIYPNGRVDVWDDTGDLNFNTVMHHEVDRRANGYQIEVALELEAFEEISQIPLSEVAFRVELLDGDEPDRPGFQTKLSTLPDRGDDAPRMATYSVGGLLPHAEVGAAPPRANAIGRWKMENGKWNFVSFEVVPRYWATLEDAPGFEKALLQSDSLKDVCRTSRKDIHLIEAYQSRGGSFRTGLVLCGERAVKGRCSSRAESNVFLVSLRPEAEGSDAWRVEQAINVFEKPLPQCTFDAIRGEPFYSHFALFPLDVLSSTVWAIGWTRSVVDRGQDEEAYGVTLLNTKYKAPHLGTTKTRERRSYSDERIIGQSSVYLTYVDDDDNVDICQIEDYTEQACSGVDRGCRTYEHGKTVLTHIQMWNAKRRKFERYELSKHRRCNSSFDFSQARGYLILQLKNRIGLLPSPATNAKEESTHKLDLF
jgi:hypothetical protein